MNGKRVWLAMTLVCCFLSVSPIAQWLSAHGPPGDHDSDSEAQVWLDKLKSLEGEWVQSGTDTVIVSYRVVAGGSAVMETEFPGQDHEMLSMYFLDGDQLIMQHYCSMGNQPRFAAVLPPTESSLKFDWIGGSNIDADRDPHIHSGKLTFVSADHLQTEWVSYADGKPADTYAFDLVRKPRAVTTASQNSEKGKKDMARFMFIYRSSEDQHKNDFSPEQMQKVMEAWNGWIGKGMQEGWMVDPGDALNLEGRVMNKDKVVSDGPFVESKEIVGGYSIVQADDFDAACEFAKDCPALEPDGTIEIRELAQIGEKE